MSFVSRIWHKAFPKVPARSFTFDRPLLIIQSDDWGRAGVRDREGFEQLRSAGLRLGEHPYDHYSLETAEDVIALHTMLKRHRDYAGRSPSVVMNFVMANIDFSKTLSVPGGQIQLMPLTEGLPGRWSRPGLTQAYFDGIKSGAFFPALHGLTHFCARAVEQAQRSEPRAALLQTLWKAEASYIYWRMPWVGYEYLNPESPRAGFLATSVQRDLIARAAAIFHSMFGQLPVSACAPGYRANDDTRRAWSASGVRVAQNGSGSPMAPHMDDQEILNLHRTIDVEPSQRELAVEKYLQLAGDCFARGVPAIISVHSINFHSTLKDFRTTTLQTLDSLLSALRAKFPNLLYVHDGDMLDIVTRGKFKGSQGIISVGVKQHLGELPGTMRGRSR